MVTYHALGVTSQRMLTEAQVRAATYAGDGTSWDVRWDGPDGVPGFGCRVYPSGRKSYVVIYRVDGRRRTLAIGSAARLSLVEARSRAKRIRMDAADGIDVLADRRRRREGLTGDEVFVAYLTRHARPRKARRTWQEDARRLGYRWEPETGRFLPTDYERYPRRKRSVIHDRLARTALAAVTTADIADLQRRVGEQRGPCEANRQLELLRSVFYWAREQGLLPADASNPAQTASRRNPKGIVPFPERGASRPAAPSGGPDSGQEPSSHHAALSAADRMRDEAEALLEEADRTREVMRQRAIDLLQQAERLRQETASANGA